jgi:hypothetical protein
MGENQSKVAMFLSGPSGGDSWLQLAWTLLIVSLISMFIKTTLESFAQQHAKEQDDKFISQHSSKKTP